MNRARKELMGQGIRNFTEEKLTEYEQEYHAILHDFIVPFENNISERDLRKAKNGRKWQAGSERKADTGYFLAGAIPS